MECTLIAMAEDGATIGTEHSTIETKSCAAHLADTHLYNEQKQNRVRFLELSTFNLS